MRRKTGKDLNCANCSGVFYVPLCRLRREGTKAPKFCSDSCKHAGRAVKHGHGRRNKKTLTYYAWKGMNARTRETADLRHKRLYFDSGIAVCLEWQDSFENFLRDLGEKPPRMTLERRDNTRGYSEDNCYWATQKQQTRNTRNSRLLTLNDKTQCVGAWAEETGLKSATILRRVNSGWTTQAALTVPVQSFGARSSEWRTA